ncbi:hypothetical protein [Bradyrhizobium sp. JYMT SZCCT0428]|uniref:hypothetical protein n=1 Tax=Bradyrhizobium sp. JYMT SZCCT0428 TaxID=2807673 RepID=UPI001BA45FBD|nr:hypothetical protein [Bradyrhizobium sp. JYMT SZCCT0428]MBR1153686.1 hypothetical protein [Bradyrhizobium sp. JYMT SZCCT0428]
MNILFLYNSTQTYTATVFEQINSFALFSRHAAFFCHLDQFSTLELDLSRFDAVAIHYSVRLPFDQISESAAQTLTSYRGLKFLFIQDEYDHTCRAWHWINRLGIRLVFTAVPTVSIPTIYPPDKLPDVRFVNNLTGYVPENLEVETSGVPASKREIVFGYRGRPLHVRYGSLGQEKVAVGEIVRNYCAANNIRCDIAWSEAERIYGPAWYEFLRSCRAVLGSESGSNVFDWDNSLWTRIDSFKRANPSASDDDIYEAIVKPVELDGIMNQVSPRVFETIAAGAVLVLFEGNYSGLIKPGKHFISLKKDGSNLGDICKALQDGAFIDEMTRKAFEDVIAPGTYSYKSYVGLVDDELDRAIKALRSATASNVIQIGESIRSSNALTETNGAALIELLRSTDVAPTPVTTNPIFYKLPMPIKSPPSLSLPSMGRPSAGQVSAKTILINALYSVKRTMVFIWLRLPLSVRRFLRPAVHKAKQHLRR